MSYPDSAEVEAIRSGSAKSDSYTGPPVWIRPCVPATVWVLLVAYGTLLPFEFLPKRVFPQAGGFWEWLVKIASSPKWFSYPAHDVSSLGTPQWVNDLAANVLLYAPLGLLVRLDVRQRGRGWISQMAVAVGVVFGLSWALECVQGLFKGRVGSWNDVCYNTAGGVLGGVVAVWVAGASRWCLLKGYQIVSRWVGRSEQRLGMGRAKPILKLVNVGLAVATLFYWWESVAFASGQHAHRSAPTNWLPFAEHFKRSFDVAAVQIGQSVGLYAMCGAVLLPWAMRAGQRASLGWVAVMVGGLGAVREVIDVHMNGGRADVTEPIIGLMAGGIVVMAVCWAEAVVRVRGYKKQAVSL